MSLETDEDDDRPGASVRVDDVTSTPSTGEPATPASEQARGSDDEQAHEPSKAGGASAAADGFGPRGWALTGVLFLCVVVIPGIIYTYPYAAGGLGFTFFATYLALPLVPAALLGLVAIWSMTAAVADE